MTFYRLNWIKIYIFTRTQVIHMPTEVGNALRYITLPSLPYIILDCLLLVQGSEQAKHVVCVPALIYVGREKNRAILNVSTSFFPQGYLLRPRNIFNCLPHKLIFLALLTCKISSPLAMIPFSTPPPPLKQINYLPKIPKEERVGWWTQ